MSETIAPAGCNRAGAEIEAARLSRSYPTPLIAATPARIPLRRTPTSDAQLRVEVVGDEVLLQVREQQCHTAVEDLPQVAQLVLPIACISALIAALAQVRR
jgi:hypothetical protein